ncbi:discoidin domain-containing protein [Paludisphaera sp.]|uniref:discoidin domain-containing protein n=1 Tax=Paludisphaera sp. TaxID=2017432 RepID=UPI00301CD8AD
MIPTRRRGAPSPLSGPLPLEPRALLATLIAIVDTGVDLNDAAVLPYLDLESGYDAYNKVSYADVGRSAIVDTSAAHGHGSVVAGMTVRGIIDAASASGVAPDVKIMPIRDTSSGIRIDGNALIRGIYYAADKGASVINLSVTYAYNPTYTDATDPRFGSTLVDAIAYAESKGAVVVTAPGNNSRSIEAVASFPAYADDAAYSTTRPTPTNVVVAAATDARGVLTAPSNWGPVHVDFGAYGGPEGYTSYSAAYTSGVAGVVASLLPADATARQVINVLTSTVTPKTQSVGAWSKTGGVLDPAAAVARAQAAPIAADGSVVIDAGSSADAYYQGGRAVATSATVDASGVESPPPQSTWRTARQGSAFSYNVDGLTPGGTYRVRLAFSETGHDAAGQRLFDVSANGSKRIAALDVFDAAGGANRGVTRDLIVKADGTGAISIGFRAIRGEATVDALEILPLADLAAGKPATSSSIESWSYNPSLAVDFSSSTRWSSGQWMQPTSTAWYQVDLQDLVQIDAVRLNWERAYAVDYQIQTSVDGANWTTIKSVTGNQSAGVVDLVGLSGEGRFLRVYCTQVSAGANNYSLYDLQVMGSRPVDLAAGKTAVATSSESGEYGPAMALDGDGRTRWSSGQWMRGSSVAWLSIDLGSVSSIRDVRLNWEAAYAADYQIQASLDGVNWTTLASVTGNRSAGPALFSELDGVGRYVRILCLATGPEHNNYSLWDFNVYGQPLSNLSAGRVATSSSNESNFYGPSMAIDPNLSSRWSSGQWSRPDSIGWLAIDLGARYDVSAVVLDWERAAAVDYQIQISDDGASWRTIRTVTGNTKVGVDAQSGLVGAGRHLRIYATKTGASNNYSLFDVKVYGTPSAGASSSSWSTWSAVAAAPLASAATLESTTTDAEPAPARFRPPIRGASHATPFAGRLAPGTGWKAFAAKVSRPGMRTSDG